MVGRTEVEAAEAVAAFAAVRPRLEALAARITGDRDEAADVASDALVALLERGPVAAADVVPWLFTVTRNRALNRVRDRARAARRVLPVMDEPPPPTTANGPLRALLHRAESRLAARDRIALRLRFQEDASYAEVALALGTNEANARLVVHRAARRFRRETVTLLADHHDAATECRSSLVASAMARRVPAHPGCHACTSVIDEVQALAANGLLPLAAATKVVRRVIDKITVRVGTRLPVNEHLTRLGEGAAALVVAGTMAIGVPSASPPAAATAPAAPLPDAPALAQADSEAVAPTISTPRGEVDVVVSVDGGGADTAVAVASPVPAATPDNVTEDAADDAAPLTSSFAEPVEQSAPAWAPRFVTDAFASEQGQGADVRRFEVASVAAPDGIPVGLRFTIDVDGPPGDDIGYTIAWEYADTECTSDRIRVDYHAETKPRQALWTHSCSTDNGYESFEVPVPFAIDGAKVTVDLPFAAVPEDAIVGPAPGVALAGVYVVAMDYQRPLALFDSDRAPDSGGIDYRVEREPDRHRDHGTS